MPDVSPAETPAVSKDSHAAWITGSGRAGHAGDREALFPYWSFTKTVLAICALQLVDDGALDLDGDLDADLDGPLGAPLNDRRFTLRQLLAHTSGLPDYGPIPDYGAAVAAGEPPWPRQKMLDLSLSRGMLFAPGQGWSYSNIGYMFVGEVIAQAAGAPLASVIADRVCRPLGLRSVKLARTQDDFARLHWPAAASYDPGWVYHGCLVGTAMDAARLLHRLMAGDVLNPATMEQMLRSRHVGGPLAGRPWSACGYGLGLMAGTVAGVGRGIGHSGCGPFCVNAVYHFPDCADPVTVASFAQGRDEGVVEWAAARIAQQP